MSKYRCLRCKKEDFECSENKSGIGICPECTPFAKKDMEEMPKDGDIPEKYKYLFQ